jgi:hypothetical protein
MVNIKYFVLSIILFIGFTSVSFSQIYPVAFSERVDDAAHIVIAKVDEKIAYWDEPRHNIYTLNILTVTSYLKGYVDHYQIGLISLGGMVGNQMEVSYPSIQLTEGEEVLVLLGENNEAFDYKSFRTKNQALLQCTSDYGVQGVLKYQNGKYLDNIAEMPLTEEELLKRVKALTSEEAKHPNGDHYRPREAENNNQDVLKSISGLTSTAATGFVAGTIEENNELIISGSGFGSAAGEIVFKDASSGGLNDYKVPSQTIESDIISWSNEEIRVKIPPRAGTGTIDVLTASGSNAGSASITIDYSINNVSSNFYQWPEENRNRVELLNLNGTGGYTFEYNNNTPDAGSSFHANSDAREAFERAIESWTCNTFVNFDVDDSGTSVIYANDNVNIITFYNLSGGTLGVTNLRYTAGANGGCTGANTLWYLKEIDIRLDYTIIDGYSWNYGPGPTSNNQFDFETIAVHELGHAHGLGHIIAPGKVMHYAINNGAEVREPSVDDIAAGTHKVSHSVLQNCITSPTPMVALTDDDCGVALPLEWIGFTAKEEKSNVRLYWETFNEQGNDYFTIERSSDSNNFHEIGKVAGAGHSDYLEDYTVFDHNPMNGINYYRIKQADFNNTSSYSKIEAVEINDIDLGLVIYPNPIRNGHIKIGLNSNEFSLSDIKIFDARGKLITTKNHIEANYFEIEVDDLPQGVYLVQIRTTSGHNISKRFVKQ